MIGTGTNSSKTSSYNSGNGWSSATNLPAVVSTNSPAFAIRTNKGDGIALYRNSAIGSEDIVRYSVWNAASGFGTFKDMNGAMPSYARTAPTVVASSAEIHIGLLGIGVDNKYHYASFDGMNFSPTDEIVKNANSTSIGFCSPAMALLGTKITVLNPGYGDEALYNRIRVTGTMGTWDMGYKYTSIPFQVDDVTPAIVSLSQGPEYLVVVTEKNAAGGDTKPLYSLTGTGTNWTAPVAIPTAKSIEITLMAIPNGHAILAFREYNADSTIPTKILWTRYDGTQWLPVNDAAPGVLAKSKPALALGAGDAEAELLFIDSAGNAQHARLRKDALMFDPPVLINGASGLVGIAAATNL
jgi:hypothetical protein